jgi:hypothetical protein
MPGTNRAVRRQVGSVTRRNRCFETQGNLRWQDLGEEAPVFTRFLIYVIAGRIDLANMADGGV